MNIQRKEQPIAWALILLGVLALLTGGGLFSGLSVVLRTLLFGLGGALLVRRYLEDPKEIWALVVGLGLIGVAMTLFSSTTTMLALIGLGFATLYWRDKRQWWAVLPAGLFLSLAVAMGLGGTLLGTAPLLFLGFAATFSCLMRLGKAWAIYPAIAALVVALLSSDAISGSLLPLLLIGGGLYLFANPAALSRGSGASPSPTQSEPVQSEPEKVDPEKAVEKVNREKHTATEPEPAQRAA